MLSENERWLLSFYRSSEASGSLLFGRLALSLGPGRVQHDLTRHFADEAQHAWYWTDCLARLGATPLKMAGNYQDRYLAAAGLPANVMEILALTQVFERRVIGQYARHRRRPGLAAPIVETLDRILEDEAWHIAWIHDALRDLQRDYGSAHIQSTLARYAAADQEVARAVIAEHAERLEVAG
jgi:bacterioferritin (cytochrome b1)